jgi:hypothetical protein
MEQQDRQEYKPPWAVIGSTDAHLDAGDPSRYRLGPPGVVNLDAGKATLRRHRDSATTLLLRFYTATTLRLLPDYSTTTTLQTTPRYYYYYPTTTLLRVNPVEPVLGSTGSG